MFNKRDSRTQQQKPVNEHVTVEVPFIIPRTEFEVVSATLKTRDPRVTAPRVVSHVCGRAYPRGTIRQHQSWPRARPALDLCARRPPVRRPRSAGGRVLLLARSWR
ncbi:hypothetical protein GWG67_06640 [Bradyrhizobium sp. CSS354]|nr:hypothetical protein [Bradyrhizobium sp. CSS354]